MKLLVVTQILDSQDPALGFFTEWVRALAQVAETVEVICLKKGAYDLPKNVHVHSLGKEDGRKPRLAYVLHFSLLAWSLRRRYDAVFVHMNVEYLLIAGPLWRLLRKKVALWYVHGAVSLRLRLALAWADLVFTASPESFRIKSPKIRVVGHGIEAERFENVKRHAGPGMRIVTAGRIAPAKRIDRMLDVMRELDGRQKAFDFEIIGAPVTDEDAHYLASLKASVVDVPYADRIRFAGPVPHDQLPETLEDRSVFLNLSTTGSMDKAVLEALAAGLPVVTTNRAFEGCAAVDYSADDSAGALASAVIEAAGRSSEPLRAYARQHSLAGLAGRILEEYDAPEPAG